MMESREHDNGSLSSKNEGIFHDYISFLRSTVCHEVSCLVNSTFFRMKYFHYQVHD
jgi:hypothetical protein